MDVSVVSLALSLIVVMGFTSTLYHPNLAPVLAEESFQNYTVAEYIVPLAINISIVEGSTW
ncbi:MAG: hypothetical protein WBX01_00090 [Nitrososphaeraceae archaeon]|jgi:hypothetical protein